MSCYSATVSQGTWGALPAPSLSTVVAAPNGGQAGIGVNDELTVTWSLSTVLNTHCCCRLHPVLMHNTKNPHVNCMTIHQNKMGLTTMTKTQIDSLLRFTADGADVSIGSSYTGVWDDEATLRITLLDVTGAGLPSRTRVGKLVAAARSGNTLKSFDGSSPVATGSATLTGSWCVSCCDCWVLHMHTRGGLPV